MSEIKVNSIKGVGATNAAITVNNSDGTCTANITNNLSNRNLIINGAMQVAQRGTSSTSTGYQTVDRIQTFTNDDDEAPTYEQVNVASSTTPYSLGFRKAFKVTNGNQTGGADAGDYIIVRHKIEAQNLANSGWNYTSASSFVTLSFWVKASVAQNYYFSILSSDGTLQNFPMETGSLTADTWTKITKTIPGASGVQFNNDNGIGIELDWWPFAGTSYTSSGVALNTWAAYASGTRFPDHTSTWWTTNDATFEITGVQLEVGSVATDFEHRSYGQELELCRRYYQNIMIGSASSGLSGSPYTTSSGIFCPILFSPTMRTPPTVISSSTSGHFRTRHGDLVNFDGFTGFNTVSVNGGTLISTESGTKVVGDFYWVESNNSGTVLAVNAEL